MYKDTNNKLRTTLYKKQIDHQNYSHANSKHPRSLKESIAYNQALHVKDSEFEADINTIKGQFVKCRYEKTLIENQI